MSPELMQQLMRQHVTMNTQADSELNPDEQSQQQPEEHPGGGLATGNEQIMQMPDPADPDHEFAEFQHNINNEMVGESQSVNTELVGAQQQRAIN